MDFNSSQKFQLRIADLTVEVTCDGSIESLGVDGAKERFIVRDMSPDVNIRAARRDLPQAFEGTLLFDAGAVWKLYEKNGSYNFRFTAPQFGPRPYKIAVFNPDFSDGEVFIHPDLCQPGRPVDPLWGPLDELLFGNLLSRGRGVEVHGCGIIDPLGKGRLFVGVSTAGKTTMARLWEKIPGVVVLSDDRIILRRMDGKIRMYGTPWHGEGPEGGQAVARSTPVTSIYFLKKASQNGLLPLKEYDTVSHFFPCSFLPMYHREAVDFTRTTRPLCQPYGDFLTEWLKSGSRLLSI